MAKKPTRTQADDVLAARLKALHAQDEADVRAGRRSAESLHVIPRALVKKAKITMPKDAFATGKKSW